MAAPNGNVEIEYTAMPGCACAMCGSAAHADPPPPEEQTATSTSQSYDSSSNDADQGVDALLSGSKWATTSLTFSFPDSASDYSYDFYGEANSGFSSFNAAQEDAVRISLDYYASYSQLEFTELTGSADRNADLMFAESSVPSTAWAYYPSSGDWGGDSWFNRTSYNSPETGNYAWSTVMHEIGHALGLKHGHETNGPGAIPTAEDSHEYSIMTYRSYVGSPGSFYSNGTWSGPQTPMIYDIAAIQVMYGANFGFNSGDTIYTFSATTGQMFVNGVPAAAPGGNYIFRAVWDGDGEDTYDFSNYARAIDVDLSAGGYVDLDVGGNAQRAYLGGNVYAKGHVFNALQYQGDERSLIENAIGGSAGDVLRGNQADNLLWGEGGADTLTGGAGDDSLFGGSGADDLDAGVSDGGWQYLYGEDGDDVYHYGTSAGRVFISAAAENASSGAADRVIFSDLNYDDITFGSFDYGGDQGVALILGWTIGGESGELRIANLGAHIEAFEFADGSVHSDLSAEIGGGDDGGDDGGGDDQGGDDGDGGGDDQGGGDEPVSDRIDGGDGADTLTGTEATVFMFGGAGDDVLDPGENVGGWKYVYGQSGNDTYLYGTESNHVFLSSAAESAGTGTADRVVFKDLNYEDVAIYSYNYGGTEGNALILGWTVGGATGQLRISNMGAHIEAFEFADGMVLGQIEADVSGSLDRITGTSGDDVINGSSYSEFIRGGAGDDTLDALGHDGGWQYLYGQSGNDTYQYGRESGRVFLSSAAESAGTGSADRVVFKDLNYDDLTVTSFNYGGTEGNALILSWSEGGESGELRISNMGAHIEEFVFADGMALGQIEANVSGSLDRITGTAGDDVINGSSSSEFIRGGAGDDTLDALGHSGGWQYLYGEAGDDTYYYGTDAGHVFLGAAAEDAGSGTADTIIFKDLNFADLTVTSYDYTQGGAVASPHGEALILRWFDEDGSGELRIADMGVHIESFVFADGEVRAASDFIFA